MSSFPTRMHPASGFSFSGFVCFFSSEGCNVDGNVYESNYELAAFFKFRNLG